MKVSKEFYISDFDLEDVNKNLEGDISLSRNENKVYKNKITITYEIDREVTIKESDFRRAFDDLEFSGRDYALIKQRIFGGGENEQAVN